MKTTPLKLSGLALSLCAFSVFGSIPVEPVNPSRFTPEEARATQARADLPQSAIEDQYRQAFQEPPARMEPSFEERVAQTWRPTQHFQIEPKKNIMIAVGQGLMNTISTNFTMLVAKTNDEYSSIEIDEGYLYVTVSSMNPISLVMYEEGVLDSQISVTLVPVAAPPTIAKIDVTLTPDMQTRGADFRKQLELSDQIGLHAPVAHHNDPHQKRIIDILTPIAQGDIPRGYGLTGDIPAHLMYPCQMTISHQAKQRLVGARDAIDIVLVVNDTETAYSIREEMCITEGTLAVALFDKAFLQPGEATEIYIMRDLQKERVEQNRQRRPRLIGE